MHLFISLSVLPRSRIPGSHMTLCLCFRKRTNLFQRSCNVFLFHLQCTRVPVSPHLCQCLLLLQFSHSSCSSSPMDCSPPGSFVHGISQARTLERVAISSSRDSSRPRAGTRVSCISCVGRQILYPVPSGKPNL